MNDHDENRLRQQEHQLQATDEVVVPSSTKKRWRLLAQTISKKARLDGDVDVPLTVTRRFATFGLAKYEQVATPTSSIGVWKSVAFSSPDGDDSFHVAVHFLSDDTVSVEDLIGFNNTGNVCVWPAEEVMAYFVWKHREICAHRRVVELGAGMTGLAGLFAAGGEAESVLLTDGNEKSVRNLELIVAHGEYRNVSARRLRWDVSADVAGLEHSFDVVLAADCLFFDDYRQPLLDTIVNLLSSNGVAYIFAPSRSGTLDKFAQLVNLRSDLSIEIETDYDDVVSGCRDAAARLCADNGFEDNLHYAKLIVLKKKRLKAAVQYTVGKICEERDDAGRITFSREFIAQLGQLTFDFLSDTWAKDLELFARHAKRTSVNADDVKLLVRNNPSLLAMLTEQADAMMAAASVQKEQSAKRKQIKKDEEVRKSPQRDEERESPPTNDQQPQPTAVASTDFDDDSLDGIDWEAFDRPITTNPSENRPQATHHTSSTKAKNDDMFDFDSDVDDDFQEASTSRPVHLDSTRLPTAMNSTNLSVSKTPLKDQSIWPAANDFVSPTERVEGNISSVKRLGIKGAPVKIAAAVAISAPESAPKNRAAEKRKNTSATTTKKAKRTADSNRSSVGNLTTIKSFDDDDDDDDFV